MAYYTDLIVAWNSSVQPPTGVTGTGLTSTMASTTKLANVNAWTVTGAVPASLTVLGSEILNCVAFSEFNALSSSQQSNVLAMCQVQGPLLGGSANVSHMAPGMVLSYFGSSSVTIANLTALAKSVTESWCQTHGYPYDSVGGLLNGGDLAAAGLS